MMWLTLGGGFLATLTTVPTPASGCEVVVTVPATHAQALAPGKPLPTGSGEVSLVIKLPKAACSHPTPPTADDSRPVPPTVDGSRPTPPTADGSRPVPPTADGSRPSHPRWTIPAPHPRHPSPITVKPLPTPTPEPPPSPTPKPKPAPARTKGAIAAAAALAKLGTPFSWGGGAPSGPTRGVGRGANTTGFDCSGLTLYAWSRAGVKLTHYTGAQFRQGRRVPLSDLRKGDLVFFGGGTGDPTHVGLYLSNGIMIHAPKTGDVVKKTQFLNSSYYRSVYRGAVRPG
ncbi:NlpC/P60 family protein [Nonomuraea typhae]|uniref:NlpC/P60 family protein n=1 Tax=Nonomuraea typhae TaxID=2603600 RepID=A0ABW7YYP7_9ACTN